MRVDGVVRSAAVAGGATFLTVAALVAGSDVVVGRIAQVCELASAVAVLCAAVFFYVNWHVAADASMAWLVTVSSAFSLQMLNWLTLTGADGADDSVWVHAFQMGVIIALGTLLVRGDRLTVRWDPLAVGLLLGFAVILYRIAVISIPAPAISATQYVVVVAGLTVGGLANAVFLLHSGILTPDLRHRLALASVFLTVGQVSAADGTPHALLYLSAATNAAGSVVLLSSAVVRARRAVLDEAAAIHVLSDRLERATRDLQGRQAQLHEIRGTLAGIATATELQRRAEISPQRREQLQSMAVAELHRLGRLVSDTSTDPEPTELDSTLRPIILRHQTAGLAVEWRPSGQVVLARPDDVAEILNILLTNAARHAGEGSVYVDARAIGSEVQVSVTDEGPGVSPDVLPRLFTWGAHGPRSSGQGIGLAAARMLAEDLEGSLELAPGPGRSARFVLSLPVPVPAESRGLAL